MPSPAGGWVTSAPRKITGCWNTAELRGEERENYDSLNSLEEQRPGQRGVSAAEGAAGRGGEGRGPLTVGEGPGCC